MEEVNHLALVALVNGPKDLVAGAIGAAIKVGELRRDGERGAVGVPGEAGEGKGEVAFWIGDDITVGRDLPGESQNRLAIRRESITGLIGHVVIEVELNGLARAQALAIIVVKLTNHT